MSITTWTITLKMDFADPQKYEVMREMARNSARDMFATAMLLKDKREPIVMLMDSNAERGDVLLNMMDEMSTPEDKPEITW